MRLLKQSLAVVMLLMWCLPLFGQDVEDLIKKARGLKEKAKETISDTLQITGSVSAQTGVNYIMGVPRRSDPYSYQINGAVNFSIYGLSVPLSLNFANKRAIYNYDLPKVELPSYSFAGMSPTYKWATLHLGDRSMTFSPYTLSGHGFRGFGTELKPGKVSFSAMYGRLQRANANDLNNLQDIDPVYKRMAWGFKAGYDTGSEHIYVILFKGWDDTQSLPVTPITEEVAPADNTTISVQGKKQLSERFSFSVDYALSAFTPDSRLNEFSQGQGLKSMLGLFQARENSEYYSAVKSTLGLKVAWGDLSLNHEWVQPGYRTLGALFFNNDFENYTLGTNTKLFEEKLNLSTSFGVERNNLSGTAENTDIRLVGSLNANLMIGEQLNINGNYSNFKNTSKQSAVLQPQILVDSIVLSQVNQSASFASSYVMGAEKNSTISTLFSFNQANSIQNDTVLSDRATTNYTSNLAYAYTFTSKLSITSALVGNWNQVSGQNISSFTPTVNARMPLLEGKVTLASTLSYVTVFTDKVYSNSIISWQSNCNYIFKEKHNFGLLFSIVNQHAKNTVTEDQPSFTELIGGLNYSWRF